MCCDRRAGAGWREERKNEASVCAAEMKKQSGGGPFGGLL